MAQLQLSNISLSFGERDLLKNVTLKLGDNDRIALTGANGSGKSTLMKIAAGILKQDSGNIIRQKGTTAAYLPQGGVTLSDTTLLEEAEEAFLFQKQILIQKEELGRALSEIREGDPELDSLLSEYHHLEERLDSSGYYHREERKEIVLLGLGFNKRDFNKRTTTFSGGWQMRIALAKILLQYPDILLLDEPTNYLDLEARDWLLDYLNKFQGAVLLVSHDRFFLDSTIKEVAELFNGSLQIYKGIYSDYEIKRKAELEALLVRYQAQQEEIENVEVFINRFRYKASKAKQVQSRIKYLEKLERIEIPESMKRIRFSFPPAPHSGRVVVQVEELAKTYGDLKVFSGVNLTVERGEKIAVMGKNGAGKTTLLRILSGRDTEFQGSLIYGSGVKTGYFSQDTISDFRGQKVIEEVELSSPTALYPKLRGLLGAFLFRGEEIHKPISVLSGGEQSRLALLKLLLEPHNLLIMDEPTNHLDLTSKDILLEALHAFAGTVVFVSHDRHFIEHLATRVVEMEGGKAINYYGDYSYYTWKKSNQASAEMETEERTRAEKDRISPARGRREEDKAKRTAIKKRLREMESVTERIENLEEQKKEHLHNLSLPEIYIDGEKVKHLKSKLMEIEAEEERLYSRWEELEKETKEEQNED